MGCPICKYDKIVKNDYDIKEIFVFFKNLCCLSLFSDKPPTNIKDLLFDNAIVGLIKSIVKAFYYGMIMSTYYAFRYDSKKIADCFYRCPNCGHYSIQCNNCHELFSVGTKEPIEGKKYTCDKCNHEMALLPVDDDPDRFEPWYYGDPNGTYYG